MRRFLWLWSCFKAELFLVLPGYLTGEANPFIGVQDLAKPQ